jgi:hypothetical protein
LRKTERIKDTNNYIKGEKYLILAEIYKGNAHGIGSYFTCIELSITEREKGGEIYFC